MPCPDGRDDQSDAAARAHHVRMEQLMERMLKDRAVPAKYRDAYAEEQRRYAKDRDDVMRGIYKGEA